MRPTWKSGLDGWLLLPPLLPPPLLPPAAPVATPLATPVLAADAESGTI